MNELKKELEELEGQYRRYCLWLMDSKKNMKHDPFGEEKYKAELALSYCEKTKSMIESLKKRIEYYGKNNF